MHAAPGNEESKVWALFCHVSPLVVGLVGPLVIWLVKKDQDPFVARHGREALNFQISLLIYGVVGVVLSFVTFGLAMFVVVPALIALAIAALVFEITAAIRASEGRHYRYPLTLRLIH